MLRLLQRQKPAPGTAQELRHEADGILVTAMAKMMNPSQIIRRAALGEAPVQFWTISAWFTSGSDRADFESVHDRLSDADFWEWSIEDFPEETRRMFLLFVAEDLEWEWR
jgi:hypothetical protein